MVFSYIKSIQTIKSVLHIINIPSSLILHLSSSQCLNQWTSRGCDKILEIGSSSAAQAMQVMFISSKIDHRKPKKCSLILHIQQQEWFLHDFHI